MKQTVLTVKSNERIAPAIFRMVLSGDISDITRPGQFVNIKLDGLYLRRPISVCDVNGNELTIIYKTVGKGTEYMSSLGKGAELDVLTGLGNGYDTSLSGDSPLLIGGGVGVPPLYYLAKKLVSEGKKVSAVLGFRSAAEIILEKELKDLGVEVIIATEDGSWGRKGFVTDALPDDFSYVFTCGPEPMLKAVFKATKCSGQYSFEQRMGCGFGACMGCSCRTVTGYKRICKEGPVMLKEDILW